MSIFLLLFIFLFVVPETPTIHHNICDSIHGISETFCNGKTFIFVLNLSSSRGDRTWSTGEGNGKPLQCSSLENPVNSMKRQNDKILKEELPRSVGAPNATGDQWKNNSRKNEGMEPKQKQYPAVDVTGDRSKV